MTRRLLLYPRACTREPNQIIFDKKVTMDRIRKILIFRGNNNESKLQNRKKKTPNYIDT